MVDSSVFAGFEPFLFDFWPLLSANFTFGLAHTPIKNFDWVLEQQEINADFSSSLSTTGRHWIFFVWGYTKSCVYADNPETNKNEHPAITGRDTDRNV